MGVGRSSGCCRMPGRVTQSHPHQHRQPPGMSPELLGHPCVPVPLLQAVGCPPSVPRWATTRGLSMGRTLCPAHGPGRCPCRYSAILLPGHCPEHWHSQLGATVGHQACPQLGGVQPTQPQLLFPLPSPDPHRIPLLRRLLDQPVLGRHSCPLQFQVRSNAWPAMLVPPAGPGARSVLGISEWHSGQPQRPEQPRASSPVVPTVASLGFLTPMAAPSAAPTPGAGWTLLLTPSYLSQPALPRCCPRGIQPCFQH